MQVIYAMYSRNIIIVHRQLFGGSRKNISVNPLSVFAVYTQIINTAVLIYGLLHQPFADKTILFKHPLRRDIRRIHQAGDPDNIQGVKGLLADLSYGFCGNSPGIELRKDEVADFGVLCVNIFFLFHGDVSHIFAFIKDGLEDPLISLVFLCHLQPEQGIICGVGIGEPVAQICTVCTAADIGQLSAVVCGPFSAFGFLHGGITAANRSNSHL